MCGPGPAAYKMPTTVGYKNHDPTRCRSPVYTLRTRKPSFCDPIAPGPKYDPGRMTCKGAYGSPIWTMGARIAEKPSIKTPGPGAYYPERCTTNYHNRPKYTIPGRRDHDLKDTTPGPKYTLISRPASPAYTCRNKTGFDVGITSPGPAAYDVVAGNVYLHTAPAYTARKNSRFNRNRPMSPGLTAYPQKTNDPKPTRLTVPPRADDKVYTLYTR